MSERPKNCPVDPSDVCPVKNNSASLEVGVPGGFFARFKGFERSSALMLVLVIVCFASLLWKQDTDAKSASILIMEHAKSSAGRDAETLTALRELAASVTKAQERTESAIKVQTYVSSLSDPQRRALHLEMPEELRSGRYR